MLILKAFKNHRFIITQQWHGTWTQQHQEAGHNNHMEPGDMGPGHDWHGTWTLLQHGIWVQLQHETLASDDMEREGWYSVLCCVTRRLWLAQYPIAFARQFLDVFPQIQNGILGQKTKYKIVHKKEETLIVMYTQLRLLTYFHSLHNTPSHLCTVTTGSVPIHHSCLHSNLPGSIQLMSTYVLLWLLGTK